MTTPRRDHVLAVDGLRLHVTEWGDPAARPIVMLHGIRGYAETFAGIAAALQPHYRVIAYDQRGRGRSDWDPQRRYDTLTYVSDLEAVVGQLELPGRFDLLGHSMGGINAIVYAARHPQRVRRLVIEEAGPGAFEHSAGARRIQAELRDTPAAFDSWEQAANFMRALRPTVTEAAREQRLRSMLKPAPGAGFTWRYDHAGIAATRLAPDPARMPDLEPLVASLAGPTLLVKGDRSDYMQPKVVARMQALNPAIRVADIAGAGHYVHDDNPADFQAAVCTFLHETEDPHAR